MNRIRAARPSRNTLILLLSFATFMTAATAQTSSSLPSTAGMYLQTPTGSVKILGQIVSFERTGSVLASGLTGGLVSRKGNIQILGQHAETEAGPNPVFYFVPSKQEADAGGTGGDLVLIRAEANPGSLTAPRRQFEISSEGYGRASKGISITHQIELLRSEEIPGVYKLTPAAPLAGGEYIFYLARGEGMAPYVYDFSVPGGGNGLKMVLSKNSTVLATDLIKKAQNCAAIEIIADGTGSTSEYVLSASQNEHRKLEFALYNPQGSLTYEVAGSNLDAMIDGLCQAIMAGKIPPLVNSVAPAVSTSMPAAVPAAPSTRETAPATDSAPATISASSNPDGADIYIDGAFVGNAPAMLKLSSGKHVIRLTVAGYKDWSREITALTGSEVRLTANLDKQ